MFSCFSCAPCAGFTSRVSPLFSSYFTLRACQWFVILCVWSRRKAFGVCRRSLHILRFLATNSASGTGTRPGSLVLYALTPCPSGFLTFLVAYRFFPEAIFFFFSTHGALFFRNVRVGGWAIFSDRTRRVFPLFSP